MEFVNSNILRVKNISISQKNSNVIPQAGLVQASTGHSIWASAVARKPLQSSAHPFEGLQTTGRGSTACTGCMQESLQPGAAWVTDSGGSGSKHALMSSIMNLAQGAKMVLDMLRAYMMRKVNNFDSRALFLWWSRQQIPWRKGLNGASSSKSHGPFSPLGACI